MQCNILLRFASYAFFSALSFLPIDNVHAQNYQGSNLVKKVDSPKIEQENRTDWMAEMAKKSTKDAEENKIQYQTNTHFLAQSEPKLEDFDNMDFNIKPKKSKDPRYKMPDPFFTNPVGFANNVLKSWDYAFEDALNQNMTRFELESSYVAHVSIKTKKPIFGFTPRIDLGIAQGSPNGRSAQGCTISFKREF